MDVLQIKTENYGQIYNSGSPDYIAVKGLIVSDKEGKFLEQYNSKTELLYYLEPQYKETSSYIHPETVIQKEFDYPQECFTAKIPDTRENRLIIDKIEGIDIRDLKWTKNYILKGLDPEIIKHYVQTNDDIFKHNFKTVINQLMNSEISKSLITLDMVESFMKEGLHFTTYDYSILELMTVLDIDYDYSNYEFLESLKENPNYPSEKDNNITLTEAIHYLYYGIDIREVKKLNDSPTLLNKSKLLFDKIINNNSKIENKINNNLNSETPNTYLYSALITDFSKNQLDYVVHLISKQTILDINKPKIENEINKIINKLEFEESLNIIEEKLKENPEYVNYEVLSILVDKLLEKEKESIESKLDRFNSNDKVSKETIQELTKESTTYLNNINTFAIDYKESMIDLYFPNEKENSYSIEL